MFNDLTLAFLRVFSYLFLIVGAALALYTVVMAFRQVLGSKREPRHDVVFAASEPEPKAPESRESGNRR